MALQIRRGTDAQRLALSGVNLPVVGEPLFTTDTKKLFIGDGSTAGGVALGYYGSIVVSGQGTLSAANNTDVLTVVAGSNIDITTDPATDTMTISAAATFTELKNESIRIFQNNIVGLNSNEDIVINPSGTGKVDVVGNLNVSGTITGNVTGNLNGVASSVTSQANSATITASSTNTANQIVLRDASGNFSAGIVSAIGIQTDGITIGVGGNINGQGSTIGNFSTISATTFNGVLDGDVTGSVFADSSEVLVDSVVGVLRGTHIGTLITDKISIIDDTIRTLSSNEDLVIDLSGTGVLIVRTDIRATRIELYQDVTKSGITVANSTADNINLIINNTYESSSTSASFVTDPDGFSGPQIGSSVVFLRAKGNNVLDPQSVTTNDEIATLDFNGFYRPDSSFYSAAKLRAVVDGAPGSSIVPGRIEFLASDPNGSNAVRLTVSSAAVTAAVPFKLPVLANDAARTTLVPTPSQGMIIFMQSGTAPAATNQAQIFDGTSWINL